MRPPKSHYLEGRRAREVPGERELGVGGLCIYMRSLSTMRGLGQRAPEQQQLGVFYCQGFVVSTAGGYWVQLHGVCRAGRFYMARNMLI